MEVTLTPELEEMVERTVESGRFTSPGDVIREALRLMMADRDHVTGLRKDDIRRLIDEGIESQRAGRMVDGETAFAEVLAALDLPQHGPTR